MSELAPLILPGTRSWATRNDRTTPKGPARVRGRDHEWTRMRPKEMDERHEYTDPNYRRNYEQAKQVWQCLQYHYPGHIWIVKCNYHHGVVAIQLGMMSSWQEVIHIKTLKSDPKFKCVVMAGGRMLERYNMPRSGMEFYSLLTAINRFRPDFTYDIRPPE